jgi:hypothetical protein
VDSVSQDSCALGHCWGEVHIVSARDHLSRVAHAVHFMYTLLESSRSIPPLSTACPSSPPPFLRVCIKFRTSAHHLRTPARQIRRPKSQHVAGRRRTWRRSRSRRGSRRPRAARAGGTPGRAPAGIAAPSGGECAPPPADAEVTRNGGALRRTPAFTDALGDPKRGQAQGRAGKGVGSGVNSRSEGGP